MENPLQKHYSFQKLMSAIPSCIGHIIDNTRSVLAFGRWILPKLEKELKDSDIHVVRKAVYSVSDLVHDPEITAQALHTDIIVQIMHLCLSDDQLTRQGCALILKTLAGQPLGREAVLENPIALHNLSYLLKDSEEIVRLKAAVALARLAKLWMGAELLNDAGFVPVLVRRLTLEESDIISVHLETLKTLLDRDVKEQAIDIGAMETFAQLMQDERTDISSRAESCLALLAENAKGKLLAIDLDLLTSLKGKLYKEQPAEHTKAAAAIMFITITTPAKLQALKLQLIDRLIELSYYAHNQELQISCIKALTNIAEAPEGRSKLLSSYEHDIINIPITKSVAFETIARHRDTLLSVMRWEP